MPGAHGKAQITHGEGFAVCCSQQRTHDKLFHGEPYFYSRPNYGHTAKLCREPILTHGTAGFAVCHHVDTRQSLNVCRVPGLGTRQTPTSHEFFCGPWDSNP